MLHWLEFGGSRTFDPHAAAYALASAVDLLLTVIGLGLWVALVRGGSPRRSLRWLTTTAYVLALLLALVRAVHQPLSSPDVATTTHVAVALAIAQGAFGVLLVVAAVFVGRRNQPGVGPEAIGQLPRKRCPPEMSDGDAAIATPASDSWGTTCH